MPFDSQSCSVSHTSGIGLLPLRVSFSCLDNKDVINNP